VPVCSRLVMLSGKAVWQSAGNAVKRQNSDEASWDKVPSSEVSEGMKEAILLLHSKMVGRETSAVCLRQIVWDIENASE